MEFISESNCKYDCGSRKKEKEGKKEKMIEHWLIKKYGCCHAQGFYFQKKYNYSFKKGGKKEFWL